MSRMEDDEDTAARLMAHCRSLELMLALTVVKFGEPTDGGFCLVINNGDALRLLSQLGTNEPVVMSLYDDEHLRYVMHVL